MLLNVCDFTGVETLEFDHKPTDFSLVMLGSLAAASPPPGAMFTAGRFGVI